MIDARGAIGVPCITTLPDPARRAFVEDVLDEKLAAWQYGLLSTPIRITYKGKETP